jgi:predicted MFS family arabinose efflux permease
MSSSEFAMRGQILILMAGIAVTGSNSLVLSPILADVAAGLGTSPVVVSYALAAYGGATALSAFVLAPWIDRAGARKALLGGLAALVLATFVSALALRWPVLVLAQGLAGLGAGVVLPAIYALAAGLAPPGRAAKMLGRVLTGWSISLVAGVPAAALASDLAGWRAPFLLLAGLAAAAFLGTLRLPDIRVPPMPRKGPLAPLGYPGVPPLLVICLGYMSAFYGVYAFLGDHLRTGLGVSAAATGLVVLTYGIGFGLASLADPWLDRIGPRRVFPLTLLGIALIYLALVPGSASLWTAAMVTGLWGFANHLGLNTLILLLAATRPDQRGAVLGLNSAVTYLGAMLGTGAAGALYLHGGLPATAGAAALALVLAALVAHRAAAARPLASDEPKPQSARP